MRRNRAQAVAEGIAMSHSAADFSPIIRDAIIQAAVEAGGGDMVAYLKKQAETHPSAFLTLLGKVLPMQLTGGKGQPVNLEFSVRFVAADSANGSDAIDN
ncbi:hypothetical protein [Hoeflea poritis]|uniref:Uncharacterized protein n=1 Tax=Hoeflea poritis TaxID=2993659 RepID=A0ABT4VH49_9HYPH|nr:hypothetical protein [Hoeflea poritis]MDA4844011.1 hypothetical protein [Hoeflea poritis]